MNNLELQRILVGYPVIVCAADEVKVKRGQFVISNTDTKDGPGKHWVTFYFPTSGPDEFFDSLGHSPEHYDVDFQRILQRPYWMNCDQLQGSGSNACGLYCVYYVMCRNREMTMNDIVKPFNVRDRTLNDLYVTHFVNKNKP